MAGRFSIARLADSFASAGTAQSMVRLIAGANNPLTIYEFGVFADSVSSADHQMQIELKLETTTSAPTGTAFTPLELSNIGATSNATGVFVKCTAEGTPSYAASDLYAWLGPASSGIAYQFPLGREPIIPVSKGVRLKVNLPTSAVNLTYYFCWDE